MNICVFLAASDGNNPLHAKAVTHLAQKMIDHHATLIYGGSNTGLMGKLADALLAANCEVVGIVPHLGLAPEITHAQLTSVIYANDMEARKRQMLELADMFIALPGGLGTFEEIFTVWNAIRLGETHKSLYILNINHYYDSLFNQIKQAIVDGLTEVKYFDLVKIVDTVEHIEFMRN